MIVMLALLIIDCILELFRTFQNFLEPKGQFDTLNQYFRTFQNFLDQKVSFQSQGFCSKWNSQYIQPYSPPPGSKKFLKVLKSSKKFMGHQFSALLRFQQFRLLFRIIVICIPLSKTYSEHVLPETSKSEKGS